MGEEAHRGEPADVSCFGESRDVLEAWQIGHPSISGPFSLTSLLSSLPQVPTGKALTQEAQNLCCHDLGHHGLLLLSLQVMGSETQTLTGIWAPLTALYLA